MRLLWIMLLFGLIGSTRYVYKKRAGQHRNESRQYHHRQSGNGIGWMLAPVLLLALGSTMYARSCYKRSKYQKEMPHCQN